MVITCTGNSPMLSETSVHLPDMGTSEGKKHPRVGETEAGRGFKMGQSQSWEKSPDSFLLKIPGHAPSLQTRIVLAVNAPYSLATTYLPDTHCTPISN